MDNGTLALLGPILAMLVGGLILLIPIAGFTARYALKPIVEAIARFREAQGGATPGELRILEQRVALLEQQVQGFEGKLQQVTEIRQFERQLQSPK